MNRMNHWIVWLLNSVQCSTRTTRPSVSEIYTKRLRGTQSTTSIHIYVHCELRIIKMEWNIKCWGKAKKKNETKYNIFLQQFDGILCCEGIANIIEKQNDIIRKSIRDSCINFALRMIQSNDPIDCFGWLYFCRFPYSSSQIAANNDII